MNLKDNNFIKKFSHYGDILAIPFFALLVIYFYNIKNKSMLEYVLLCFSICGFILDILYSYIFFYFNSSRM
jgi:hypothetical protein